MVNRHRGFTLMEMVAVLAVIGILASIATPMVFQTIRNARVTAFTLDIGVWRTAVARYYTDTGRFPLHIATSTSDGQQLLLRNSVSAPVSGWDGPYIEAQMENPFGGAAAYRAILETTNANYQFDLDGDGNVDTPRVVAIRVDGVTAEDARKISDIIDNDGDQASWNSAGRVKRYGINSDHPTIVLIYLTEV